MNLAVIPAGQIWIVDAFTRTPFLGNAAGVCLLPAFPADAVMQRTALAMQLSETAFAVETPSGEYAIRWFTPEAEVDLCGHATLATAHVLGRTGRLGKGGTVIFRSASGELKAKRHENDAVELDFPTLESAPARPHPALSALGAPWVNCERSRDNYLVEVKDFETLTGLTPQFRKLARIDAQGVIVTTAAGIPAPDGRGFDFASRYFCPSLGIDEDPVTGSAHCTLAPYWAARLHRTRFHAFQASRGRGVLEVTLQGARTLIAGHCVTTLKGAAPSTMTTKETA